MHSNTHTQAAITTAPACSPTFDRRTEPTFLGRAGIRWVMFCLLSVLFTGNAFADEQLIQFLNAYGLSDVVQANNYYADVDPTPLFSGRRQCATLDAGNLGSVTLTHNGQTVDYQPGLQLRIFSSAGEKKETSQIRILKSGSGNGRHILEDPFVFMPTGTCLEYEIIGSAPTFEHWLDRAFGVGQDGDFVGRSFNGRDLEFGRYTTGGVRGGDIYTYVQNFRNLQGANAWQGPRSNNPSLVSPFATVAIEYSLTHGGTSRTLKYFIFNDQGHRIAKVDLDGTGDKYLPNVCHVCHTGNFIPIDLDSQTFGAAPFDRASQEDAFRGLNQILLQSNPPDHLRELIEGWYASGPTQDNSFVPSGWSHDPVLYEELVAPNCRSCHITQYYDFFQDRDQFQSLAPYIADKICDDSSPMPNALITYRLFLESAAPELFEQETNIPIPCLHDPDFEATITGITPANPEVGDTVQIEYTVANVGVGDYAGGTHVRLTLRDPNGAQEVITESIPSLASGTATTFTVQRELDVLGFWQFDLVADPNNLVPENPDNGGNTDSRIIEVTGQTELPNLIMTPLPDSVTYFPSNPQANQAITFTIRVRNHGAGATPPGEWVRVRIQSPAGTTNRYCSAIAAGGTCTINYSIVASAGAGQQITVNVDPYNQITETNETDNVRVAYFNVGSAVTCEGTWHLTGVGHNFNASAVGNVVDNCDVTWGSNQPTDTCWETVGIDDIEVTWIRNGNACPVQASAYRPRDGATFLYNVQIVP